MAELGGKAAPLAGGSATRPNPDRHPLLDITSTVVVRNNSSGKGCYDCNPQIRRCWKAVGLACAGSMIDHPLPNASDLKTSQGQHIRIPITPLHKLF